MKLIFYTIFFLLISNYCYADQITGVIDTYNLSDQNIIINLADNDYLSSNETIKKVLIDFFKSRQQITLTYNNENIIESVFIDNYSDLNSKHLSLFIGALSAFAFTLAMGVKLS